MIAIGVRENCGRGTVVLMCLIAAVTFRATSRIDNSLGGKERQKTLGLSDGAHLRSCARSHASFNIHRPSPSITAITTFPQAALFSDFSHSVGANAELLFLFVTMKSFFFSLSCLAALSSSAAAAQSNASDTLYSKQILPSTFKPPQVFKNVNLVRNVNLDKSYARETINVIIENTDKKPQDEYYLPFHADTLSRVGGFEVVDKKNPTSGSFQTEVVGLDLDR